MTIITKLFMPIGLTVGSLAIGAPCYTDIKDSCGDNSVAILVETKNTDNGLCTEYTNEDKEKIVRCHKNYPVPVRKKVVQNSFLQAEPVIIYNNQVQQITNYNNDNNNNNRNNDSGYWNGYWNGYYNDGNHRPPRPEHHRPPPRPPAAVTTPNRTVGGKNSYRRGSADESSHQNNKPQKPNNQHSPNARAIRG